MTRTELAEKETSAQVVGRTETMTARTDNAKEEATMTIEKAKKAKRRPTREQKARWKTNALMRKYDDETKATALRVYTEALDYGKVKVEATLDHAEDAVRDYLCGDWTFDDLWDLAREFGVKPRGFHDNSWDMGEGYDGQIIDRLSDIISKIGFRLREEEGLAEKQAEASEAEASGSGEKTETTKEETKMKQVTLKEIEDAIEGKKTRQEVEEYLQGLTVKMLKEMYRAMYVYPCGEWYSLKKAELIEELTEYYMPPESEEEELDDLLPDVIGYVHGQAIRRSPDYTEDSIDIEEMERESAGIWKLDAEDLKNELRSLNRAELDYLCQKFGIEVISEASKAEKRQRLLKYLDEVDGAKREKEGSDSKVA